ncbi:MAG: hypothetical protein M1831_004059 [Alyxoria varia]|nr:MAG: hypothetical protein M1831_004059 [Alyxoria varia]
MLNSRNLGRLLTENVHTDLYSQIFVLSTSGDLIAYSAPANIQQIKSQAASITLALKEHSRAQSSTPQLDGDSLVASQQFTASRAPTQPADGDDIQALTIEFDGRNIVAKPVQPGVYLVLMGSSAYAPSEQEFKITVERFGDAPYPSLEVLDERGELKDSCSERNEDGRPWQALAMQRRKAGKLATFLGKELREFDGLEDGVGDSKRRTISRLNNQTK